MDQVVELGGGGARRMDQVVELGEGIRWWS